MSKHVKPSIKRWMKGQMMKRIHGMITCREFEAFVLAYIDGDLTQNQLTIFNLHLKMCRECREYLAAYQCTMELTRATALRTETFDSSEVPEDLVKAILAAKVG